MSLTISRKIICASASAVALLLSSAPPAIAAPGAWIVDESASALDGQKTYMATVKSDEAIVGILGLPKHALLTFRCGKDGFFASLGWPDFIGKELGEDSVVLRWKVDDGPVQKATWLATTKSVFAPGDRGLAWLKSLSQGKVLVVQVPDQHGDQEATFQLTGIDEVYAKVSGRSCP